MNHRDYVEQIEQVLIAAGTPYIAVGDAKKAVFAGARIDAFDLLIYRSENNLLVTVLPPSKPIPSPRQRAALRDWQKVFGAEFRGGFVQATAAPTLWMLDAPRNEARPFLQMFPAKLRGGQRSESPAAPSPPPQEQP